jgi:AmmeMemoRadiSam system protein B
MNVKPNVRPSTLSGSWYPADPRTLAREVDAFLAAADPRQLTRGRALLVVAPHAGYTYSGPTAGRLFGLLRGQRPRTVFILAPNHRLAVDSIALSSADAFATPLGLVNLDPDAAARLAEHPGFQINDQAHAQEHAVEILLPFLQRLWPEPDTPRVVPMLVPHLGKKAVEQAAHTLRQLRDGLPGDTLLLVSSDFTHYGSAFGFRPFVKDIPGSLETLDSGAILRILGGDAGSLLDYGRETGITMCGLPAAAVALGCGLPEGYEAGLVDYTRSGDSNGDYSHSVSYASILITSGREHA